MMSFRSSTRGFTTCFLAKASSWRVRSAERLAGLEDLLQDAVERVGRGHLGQRHLRIALDRLQHVVEIMGHSPGEPADGLHLVRLHQLRLQPLLLLLDPLAFGDVTPGHMEHVLAADHDGREGNVHEEFRAVRLQMDPLEALMAAGVCFPHLLPRQLCPTGSRRAVAAARCPPAWNR